MSRTLKFLTISALATAAMSLPAEAKPPKLAPHAHIAALTETQAEAVAQSRQNDECGRGTWWSCENKRWPAASCYQGYNRWECTGGVRQMKLSPWLTFRNCSTYITVAQGVATLRDNTCF